MMVLRRFACILYTPGNKLLRVNPPVASVRAVLEKAATALFDIVTITSATPVLFSVTRPLTVIKGRAVKLAVFTSLETTCVMLFGV